MALLGVPWEAIVVGKFTVLFPSNKVFPAENFVLTAQVIIPLQIVLSLRKLIVQEVSVPPANGLVA